MRHSRRTCAKLCRAAGGELEQIQLLLGHASVQTTKRYLGTKQDLVHAPNDGIKLRVFSAYPSRTGSWRRDSKSINCRSPSSALPPLSCTRRSHRGCVEQRPCLVETGQHGK